VGSRSTRARVKTSHSITVICQWLVTFEKAKSA
jgi:hypothetical protein